MVKIISKNKFVFCVDISYFQSCVGVLGFLQWPPEGTSRLFKPRKSAEFMLNNGNLTSLNFDDSLIPTAAARGRTRLVAKKRRKSA